MNSFFLKKFKIFILMNVIFLFSISCKINKNIEAADTIPSVNPVQDLLPQEISIILNSSPAHLGKVNDSFVFNFFYENAVHVELKLLNLNLHTTGTVSCSNIQIVGSNSNHPSVVVADCVGDGTFRLEILPGTSVNAKGELDSGFLSETYTVDNTGPEVSLSMGSPKYGTNLDMIEFLVTYTGEPVNYNLTSNDVSLVNGTCDAPVVVDGNTESPRIQVSNCTSYGSFGFIIQPHSTVDNAGNLSRLFTHSDLGYIKPTVTLRVSTSATNVPGTAFGIQTDYNLPSAMDIHIDASNDPLLITSSKFDGSYSHDDSKSIAISPSTFVGTPYPAADSYVYTLNSQSPTDEQVKALNWVLSQRFDNDPKFSSYYNTCEPSFVAIDLASSGASNYPETCMADTNLCLRFFNDNNRRNCSLDKVNEIRGLALAVSQTTRNIFSHNRNANKYLFINDSTDAPLAIIASGKIGDRVWHDSNNNGIQDPGEVGINNVKVELLDSLGNKLNETTTGDDLSTPAVETGHYEFLGLPEGTYKIRVILPNEFQTISLKNQGGDNELDSDINTNGLSDDITISEHEFLHSIDIGLSQ